MHRLWPAGLLILAIWISSSTVITSSQWVRMATQALPIPMTEESFRAWWWDWWWLFVKGWHATEFAILFLVVRHALGDKPHSGIRMKSSTVRENSASGSPSPPGGEGLGRGVFAGHPYSELARILIWWSAGIAAGIAALDELHQLSVPGRGCLASDWLIDCLGIAMAWLVASSVKHRWRWFLGLLPLATILIRFLALRPF